MGDAGPARDAVRDPSRARSARAEVLGLLVLLLAFVWTYRGLIGQDTTDRVPVPTTEAGGTEPAVGFFGRVDQQFAVWLISRNARTWANAPAQLFDGGLCYPDEHGLALGEPALTLGLLGVPGWLISGDPIFTYDSVLLAMTALAALALYGLMLAWTDLPAAATVAALAYAFHPLKLTDPAHLYAADTVWLVFALFFYRRWLETGRWRDALALATACALQIGGSLHPLIAAAAIGAPFAIWGAWRIGVRRTRPLQWLTVGLLIGAAAVAVFEPYVARLVAADPAGQRLQIFLPWSALWDGSGATLGFGLIALAAAAFVPARQRRASPEPHWALLAGLVLVLLFATGGNQAAVREATAAGTPPPFELPNLFAGLASLLPGLDHVRAPGWISHGSYLVLALLAGLGTRRILSWLPDRVATATGWVLVATTFVYMLRPGLPGAMPLSTWSLRPPPGKIAFFAELEARGNVGPIVELPSPARPHPVYGLAILTSAYHHRPTSRCPNSFDSPANQRADALSRQLPAPDAIRELREMGFTTVVLHENVLDPEAPRLLEQFEAAALEPGSGLRFVYRADALSAWSLDGDGAGG